MIQSILLNYASKIDTIQINTLLHYHISIDSVKGDLSISSDSLWLLAIGRKGFFTTRRAVQGSLVWRVFGHTRLFVEW